MDNLWNIEELKEMAQKVKNGEIDVDLDKELDQLNAKFISMCEDWNLLANDEQKQNQIWYYDAQLTYHDVGGQYVRQLIDKNQIEHEQTPIADSAKENDKENQDFDMEGAVGDEPATNAIGLKTGAIPKVPLIDSASITKSDTRMIVQGNEQIRAPIKDYRRILKPIFELQRITHVSEKAINEIIVAISESMSLAKECDIPIDGANEFMLIYLEQLMDEQTSVLWQWKLEDEPSVEVTVDVLVNFLVKRAKRILPSETDKNPSTSQATGNTSKKPKLLVCPRCEAAHPLHKCEVFKGLKLSAKWATVKKERLCENCFASSHSIDTCKSGDCKRCNVKHNSLLCKKLKTNYES